MNSDQVIFIVFCLFILLLWWGSRETEAQRAVRIEEENEAHAAYARLSQTPIKPSVRDAMADFETGNFAGRDQSPLGYVGYHVGKSSKLSEGDRHYLIKVCFVIELPAQFHDWGGPITTLRFNKVQRHLSALASQRGKRRNYELAVSHWTRDRRWFLSEFEKLSQILYRIQRQR